MLRLESFREWLKKNTSYSNYVIRDIVSRLKRANGILKWTEDETYLFYLEQEIEFKSLSVSVRSQLRKAIRLYNEFTRASQDN